MLKACTLTIVMAMPIFLKAQPLELSANGVHTILYHSNPEGHYSSSYDSKVGYSIGLSVDSIRGFNLAIGIQYVGFSSRLQASDGGLGGQSSINAIIARQSLQLDVFPLRFRLSSKLKLSFGAWSSVLVNEKLTGTFTTHILGQAPTEKDINSMYDELSKQANWGLAVRIAMELPISATTLLTPQFSTYPGFAKEFMHLPDAERSIRLHVGMGIKKKL